MNAGNNNTNKEHQDRLLVSYILNVVGFLGLMSGLHRLYNGKIGTGLLWMCTFGLLGIGQFADLFLIPNMVNEHEMRLKLKAGVSPFGVPLNQPPAATQVDKSPQEKLMIKLLKVAEKRSGRITVTQGVMETEASFTEVEATLKQMMKSGYVTVDNDPITGAVTYHFHELG
ncbi:hypothetical protein WA1_15150 [Scytonema hofmannii PCC 7110]|uniref:TM2 domain-containing protein n=1 Tax=Scytonema hofmannii PCC 7110 TaxID=128403 RepID=A0A139XDA6_9CYAN|nr:TM2 domain-containing protein [Scytonema hofmannii]KYC42677.1 hypothetical protein WA1_15150 [Scytonema hofmannii PCC 7110]